MILPTQSDQSFEVADIRGPHGELVSGVTGEVVLYESDGSKPLASTPLVEQEPGALFGAIPGNSVRLRAGRRYVVETTVRHGGRSIVKRQHVTADYAEPGAGRPIPAALPAETRSAEPAPVRYGHEDVQYVLGLADGLDAGVRPQLADEPPAYVEGYRAAAAYATEPTR